MTPHDTYQRLADLLVTVHDASPHTFQLGDFKLPTADGHVTLTLTYRGGFDPASGRPVPSCFWLACGTDNGLALAADHAGRIDGEAATYEIATFINRLHEQARTRAEERRRSDEIRLACRDLLALFHQALRDRGLPVGDRYAAQRSPVRVRPEEEGPDWGISCEFDLAGCLGLSAAAAGSATFRLHNLADFTRLLDLFYPVPDGNAP